MITEDKLIFIISQPRSGSSLLQQILSNSNEILSVPEPWLMLPLVYTYKDCLSDIGHNAHYAHLNFINYLKCYSGADKIIKERVASLALELYNLNRLDGEQRFFLDKTTRYYHIIRELRELFPNAKFIFLGRNPLSVFSSLIDLFGIKVFLKPDRYDDIFVGPNSIAEALSITWKSHIYIRYEDLILNTPQTLKSLNSFLSLKTELDHNYKVSEKFKTSNAIDPKSLSKHTNPSSAYIDYWKLAINDSQKKRMAIEYINSLNESVIKQLGYSINDIKEDLQILKVKKRVWTIPLNYLLAQNRIGLLKQLYRSFFLKMYK